MSIRLRLTLTYTALLALVLAGFAIVAYLAIEHQLHNQLDYEIQVRALNASRALRAVVRTWAGPSVIPLELPTAALTDTSLYVQYVDRDGDIQAWSPNLSEPLPVPPESLARALDGQEAHETIYFQGMRVELYTAPLLVENNVVGVLQVGAALQPLEQNLAQLRLVLGGVVLGATIVAAVVGWLMATRALRPVDRMTRKAHAIGTSADFSSRLDEPPQADELGRLAHTFNDMLGQLDEAMKTQRRFLADASHELRSPLTAIRMNTEALLRGGDADPAEREETLRAIARETDRMGRLVADLLALARADAGQPIEHRRVSLDVLLLDVYQQERRLADGVHLTLGDLEQVEVDGDPDRLKQLLLNLVDNALRYTPCGGTVTLSVTGDGGRRPVAGAPSLPSPVPRPPSAVVTVADTGAGIAPEHLPRVFDRFYRADPPRARKTGGTGLGLAICKWVAEAHGGRIEVESRPGEGSTFRVYLPIAGRVSGPSADGQGTTGRVRTLASSA